jgi:hypothetical protein
MAAGGRKQWVAASEQDVDAILGCLSDDDLGRHGVVVELDLADVETFSVGHVTVGQLTMAYHGVQRLTRDHGGAQVYGGSDLVCVRGGWEALTRLRVPEPVALAIRQARAYDEATSLLQGFIASRRNYDVARGRDAVGRVRSGVLEASWRAGGASGAEAAALQAFAGDPGLRAVQVSSVEVFASDAQIPPGAVVHFRGVDAEVGALVRYTTAPTPLDCPA